MLLTLENKRFFIIDDHPGNMFVMSSILAKYGGITDYERWGKTTIARMHAFLPIDLVLMDLMLPGTSGYEQFDLIRAIPEMAHIPIIAVSAADASVAIPKVRAQGFAGFIGKPLDYDHFHEQIALILSGQGVWESAAAHRPLSVRFGG